MAEEKRSYNRWYPRAMNTSVTVDGIHDEVKVADVCASGMRVLLTRYAPPGTEVAGTIFIPAVDTTFYVRGPVVRQRQDGDRWESAIRFKRVSMKPFR